MECAVISDVNIGGGRMLWWSAPLQGGIILSVLYKSQHQRCFCCYPERESSVVDPLLPPPPLLLFKPSPQLLAITFSISLLQAWSSHRGGLCAWQAPTLHPQPALYHCVVGRLEYQTWGPPLLAVIHPCGVFPTHPRFQQ